MAEWIKKMWYIYVNTHTHTHTHNGVLLGNQKEGNLAMYNYIDGTGGYYAN